jgi:hypothetical protein
MVANPVAIAMDAIEDFDEFDGLDLKAGFLADLSDNGLRERLAEFNEAAGNGPSAAGGFGASLDEQNAAFIDDDRAYADQRSDWVFALQHASTIVG